MSLRLDTPPGAATDVGERCTLVLLGFRNDLARHRVLSFLREQAAAPTEPSLPHTLYAQIDAHTGARLAAELDRLGAVVRLTRIDAEPPVAEPLAAPAEAAAITSPPTPARFAISARGVRLMVIVGVGVAWMIHLLRQDSEIVIPFPDPPGHARPAAAAAAPAQPARASRVSIPQIKQLIATGDLDGAEQAAERLADEGQEAAALALQGDVHAKRGDWQAARTAYERSVALGWEKADVFLALAGIYRQQGMQAQAVEMLHRAQQNGAKGQDFEEMEQVVVAEQDAESGFDSVTSPHFAISFDGGRDNAAAQLILSQLEDAYMVVGHKLGEYPSSRTPVVLYAAQDFERVTHSPGWAGALYDGRIKVPVRGLQSDSPDLARTIRHEYAHSLILTLSGGHCPVWLNEGVAMWAEEERDGDRRDWALGAIQLHQPFKLAELENSFMRLSSVQAAAAYAQSYLAVRHLVARYGERSLQQLLIAFATNSTTADAFRAALPVELSSFEDDLRREQDGG